MDFFSSLVYATWGRSIPGSLISLGAVHLPSAALHVANGKNWKQFCNMRVYQAEEDYQESIVGINDYIML